jgi:hypothetical protein
MSSLAVITESPLGSGCWLWRIDGTLRVAGKGDLGYMATNLGCQGQETAVLSFWLTSGSGQYAGASGMGALAISAYSEGSHMGTQVWTGTLDVPGLEFDTEAPVVHGVVNKTVRAKPKAGARVRYKLTATDAVDGAVPVSCKPPSGSRFRIGRSTVRCSAVDTSGNVATAAFTVTVEH